MKSSILLSGGIDSAACAAFYLHLGHHVDALFVDYGQPTRDAERTSAQAIARHYSIPLRTVTFNGPTVGLSGEIVGRNAFLVFTAMLYRPRFIGILALGIHTGPPYYDCQAAFVDDIARLVCGYTDGKVSLGVPFLSWTKEAIWDFCTHNRVPVGLAWSCEVGPTIPCGSCPSCKDLEPLYARAK
jgi:7-cyano-7-deazaguanine synthase